MIKNIQIVKVPIYLDDRGSLTVLYDPLQLPDVNYPRIGRVYFISNFGKGVIRAFHKHEVNCDYFFVTHGSAKFVLSDDREDSPTYRELNTLVLSDENYGGLVIPPGVWHGWMSLEDETQLINLASEGLNKAKPDEIRISPDSFGDVWIVKGR